MKSKAVLIIAGVVGVGTIAGVLVYERIASAAGLSKRKTIDARQWPIEMAAASVYAKDVPGSPVTLFVSLAPPAKGEAVHFETFLGPWLIAQRAAGRRIFARELNFGVVAFEVSVDPRVDERFAELVFS